MDIGFTGSRNGLTNLQEDTLASLFVKLLKPTEHNTFHHGSCQGADVLAARIMRDITDLCQIVAHPGPEGDHCQQDSGVDDEKLAGKNHFQRNRDIVDACQVLVCCPAQMEWQPRGGTWMTHDYAQKKRKPIHMVWPDGSITQEYHS